MTTPPGAVVLVVIDTLLAPEALRRGWEQLRVPQVAGRGASGTTWVVMLDDGGVSADQHPDYRFTLANERTFLAWVRTGLALDAAGLAVLHLLPELVVPGAREAVGLALVALAAFVTLAGYRRWQDYQAALERSQPLPATRLPVVLVAALVVLSVVTTLLLVTQQWQS